MSSRREQAARRFIEEHAPQIYDTFGVPSHFNVSTSSYELNEINTLRATLDHHRKWTPELVDLDLNLDHCTWEDVLDELEAAKAATAVSEGGEGIKGRFKRFRHRAASASAILTPVLSAIPDELCVLHGGLALIFSIARHREQNRLKILRAFDNIPNVMEMAYNKANSFPRDEHQPGNARLHESVMRLQKTLLQNLPALIDNLNPKTIWSKTLSPFKGDEIENLLDAVYTGGERVRLCAERIMDDIGVDMHNKVADNHQATQNILKVTKGTGRDVEEIRKQLAEMLAQQKTLQAAVEAVSGQNGLFQLLVEHSKPHEYVKEESPESAESLPGEIPRETLTPHELLNLLDVHHLASIDDQGQILRQGRSLDSDMLTKAAAMIKTDQVQQLLHTPKAGIVLVNGHGDRAQSTRVSPISYVCATFAQVLRVGSSNATLVFFCGKHVDTDDSLRGPQGLMRSLLAQLILISVQHSWISDCLPIPQFPQVANREEIDSLTLEDVCRLFHLLLRAVPEKSPVFCLIDGVSYYERSYWEADYNLMMDSFAGIIADQSLDTSFKLLVTSPTSSSYLQGLEDHQKVSLRNVRASFGEAGKKYLHTAFGNVNGRDVR